MDRDALRGVFVDAIDAVDPALVVAEALERRSPFPETAVTVLAIGKAAAGMVAGARRVLGEQISGVAVTAEPADLPPGVVGYVGPHPRPDDTSVLAGTALLDAAAAAPPDGLVICLLSGGGSAMAETPRQGIAVAEIADLTEHLMLAGASIEELNSVRVGLSRLKGGGLAAAISAKRIITLAISDVGVAPPAVIASGPTLLPAGSSPKPRGVLEKSDLWDESAPSIRRALAAPPGHVAVDQEFEVVADGATAAKAAADSVARSGLRPVLAERMLSGEARDEAVRIVQQGLAGADVGIHWGETTVTVRGQGKGGRNHEAALAASVAIAGSGAAFLAAGTDGVDGSGGGAGAAVDGSTAAAAAAAGLDPVAFLDDNDSGGFFDVVPGRIDIGATGTNVADLWLFAP